MWDFLDSFSLSIYHHNSFINLKNLVRRKLRQDGSKDPFVKIWLQKQAPFYRVMAANSRSPRDGKHLEVLGYYNPLPGIGYQSEPVERILFRSGMLPPPPMVAMARKGGPCDTRPVNPMTGRPLPQENLINSSHSDELSVKPDEIVDTASTS